MRLALRILLPVVILAAFGLGAWHFVRNKPAPRKFAPPPQVTQVEGITINPSTYQIYLDSRGTVQPRTTTTLYPEVSGRIVSISPNFRDGGFFSAGETLLGIEKVDYETAVVIAQSQVAQARTALVEEKARGEQAAENWRRLGKQSAPSDMVLRKPQLAEAEARLLAAQADLEKARRDLERTDIRAPYDGRILEQQVDVGQYVSPGTPLGRAFSTDIMEVRLPLTNRQLEFIDLPEVSRSDDAPLFREPEVAVVSRIGRAETKWEGHIVRVDSSIDEASRQLFVVAEIKDPYRQLEPGGAPLKIGMFVDARIKGITLDEVFVLPRSAVRVSGEVILIDDDNRIRRQRVRPIWKAEDHVVIDSRDDNLQAGDVLCITPLAFPVNGAPVIPTIDGVAPQLENPRHRFTGPKTSGMGKGPKTGRSQGEPAES